VAVLHHAPRALSSSGRTAAVLRRCCSTTRVAGLVDHHAKAHVRGRGAGRTRCGAVPQAPNGEAAPAAVHRGTTAAAWYGAERGVAATHCRACKAPDSVHVTQRTCKPEAFTTTACRAASRTPSQCAHGRSAARVQHRCVRRCMWRGQRVVGSVHSGQADLLQVHEVASAAALNEKHRSPQRSATRRACHLVALHAWPHCGLGRLTRCLSLRAASPLPTRCASGCRSSWAADEAAAEVAQVRAAWHATLCRRSTRRCSCASAAAARCVWCSTSGRAACRQRRPPSRPPLKQRRTAKRRGGLTRRHWVTLRRKV
jgi:hypothetical protein